MPFLRPLLAALLAAGGALLAVQSPPARAIKVDQSGYLTRAPKVALVIADGAADRFVVRRLADRTAAFEGRLGQAAFDPDSGDRVRAADFSALVDPGEFMIEVPGAGESWPFAVGDGVYRHALYLAMRSFYGQRCNTAVNLGPQFPGYAYQACHWNGAYHPSSGRTGAVRPSGGWHDAGDYGRYVVNSGLTTGTLLWAWELYGDRLRHLSLDLPESANETPDVLDEIRWNLDWMASMQDADGGVWHKQTSEPFAGFVMPHDDGLTSYVIGTGRAPWKGTCATADFAAVMAVASRVYARFDRAFARSALAAARRAWTWAEAHPDERFTNPDGVATGAYGDRSCDDERLWAAAELWRTTREGSFRTYFLERHVRYLDEPRGLGPASWPWVAPVALWTYALASGPDDEAARRIRAGIRSAGEALVARTRAHPYRTGMVTGDFVWGSNGVAANYAMQLLVANALAPSEAFVHAALEHLHYLLGRNAFAVSWVSGIGADAYKHPHHRPSGADTQEAPWPGLLSGGPNRRRQDEVLKALPPGVPPAKMWVDDQASYASNEVAINWNAPLVFVLAGVQR